MRPSGIGSAADPDAVARLAGRDPRSAAAALAAGYRPGGTRLDDWPDALAEALANAHAFSLRRWAEAMQLNPASLSRGFARAYGVSPKRFRLEARARRAVRAMPEWRSSLAALAADCGFADQAHLARAVRALTGMPPAALRAKSVQA